MQHQLINANVCCSACDESDNQKFEQKKSRIVLFAAAIRSEQIGGRRPQKGSKLGAGTNKCRMCMMPCK